MTKVEARFEFTAPFCEKWLGAIESLHSVYGLQDVILGADLAGMTVVYDAARLTPTDVEHRLQRSGLPIRRLTD